MNKNPIQLTIQKPTFLSPWLYVPTLYFAAGLPYFLVNNVSVIFYKNLGIDNTQIAFWTSFLYLPWVIKMFWGSLVDLYSTKRNWVLYTQLTMACCLAGLALSLQSANFFFISLIALTIIAFVSATYDTAADGFYLLALSEEKQAFFVGIRSVFYRLAAIFSSGVLVFWAGKLQISLVNVAFSWSLAIALTALIFAVIFLFHQFALPNPEISNSVTLKNKSYTQIIKAYFTQEKIWVIVAFIVLYRFGEAMLVKITPPFLLDETQVGGLGLSTSVVGLTYGTFGSIALIVGGIIGGILIERYGIKKCLLPMALALNLPNIFYVYMAYTQPQIQLVYLLISVEQFGYGIGTAAYSVYMMYLAKNEYKTSHFAISTGLMALGMMLPGFISGYLQQWMGYQLFFIVVVLLTIPGMVTLFFIPLTDEVDISQ